MLSLVSCFKNICVRFQNLPPIGSVLAFVDDTDPNDLFYGQVWERFAQGKVLVGVDTADSNFNTVGKTGGESTHKLTIAEMPSHSHSASNVDSHFEKIFAKGSAYYALAFRSGYSDPNISVGSRGGDGAHNNLQPYETVFYWKRTA